jgi:GH15 family glucan-1,4-alpha-glucosidase
LENLLCGGFAPKFENGTKVMAYQPIENYGIIGNMRTAALVGMNGSIDWYCFPNFDSPSVFGAILDDQKGGRFQIAPVAEGLKSRQFYWPSTNILVTRFLHADGITEIEDFMPVGLPPESKWYHVLYRRVRCVRGTVKVRMICQPAFDYGRESHEVKFHESGATFRSSKQNLHLCCGESLRQGEDGSVVAEFELEEGKSHVFTVSDEVSGQAPCPASEREGEELFQQTVKYWHRWLAHSTYRGRWRERVERSALALKLLTFEPTGAIIAAPTTSLPEVIGGPRNWDYRYAWLRDAAFTVYAFVRIGFTEEAAGFVSWMRNYVAKYTRPGEKIPALFSIYGNPELPEQELKHWEGYKKSGPVRIGNGAYTQYQGDVYGELMDALYLYNKYVLPISYDFWTRIRDRLDWVCENWQNPDEGIWEMRNRQEHFVYSKLMSWVALDRGVRLADKRSFPANRERWVGDRDKIYEEVMRCGWNEKRRAFTQFYGSEDLDASVLIMPLVFFMAPSDPRMLNTIRAIMKNPRQGGLVSDGLVYRYPPESRIDGLPGEEGTFNMCSFWLVEAMTRAGMADSEMLDQARLLFERMLGYANHLGLYAEQTSSTGEALGNFPQAFTHLALISAAFNLDRTLDKK